ncbi:MAG: ABC-F family ATP-binding cassette domain-containing protein [Lachnospiraceae bacterium]|nr:ABC-F family ATP-binding cassette domain-containing protein [Lachnospiraceae bacterium]
MNLLTADHITKSYTGRKLFDEASFYLQEGEKVGIVGINGTGKSTLLKILAGLEEPDEGSVTKAGHAVIRYLPQMPAFDPDKTVLESVLELAGQHSAEDGHAGQDYTGEYVQEKWNLESAAKSMLTRLGVYNFEETTGHLSGGEKKRLALVAVLLTPCDILLLDEPTNHLDADMAEWLEDYLRSWKGAMLMVTHDRYFLDSVCNRIAEVDKGKIYSYQENYSGYLMLKQERMDMAVAAERKRQSILRKDIAWMQRGARARSTKQKAHIKRYEELKNQSGPQFDEQVQMGSISSRMGRTTVELHHISKSFGDRELIQDFSYIFLKNDRVGFVGHNGCGKTTLMKIIDGRMQPDQGEIVIGQTIRIGYYTQEIDKDEKAGIAYMDPNMKVIDYIRNTAEYVRTEEGLVSASAMLERFLFPPEAQYSLIGKLSGGEKRRLNLLRVLMEAPNVLILDEPTNDLDVTTLSILEDYLDSYQGIVITVSHDRYFLDRIVGRIFAFEPDGIRQYEGGYTDYLGKRPAPVDNRDGRNPSPAEGKGQIQASSSSAGSLQEDSSAEKADARSTWKSGRKLKFTYQEQKDYEVIEEEIAACEKRLEEIDNEMAQCARDFVKLGELTREKQSVEDTLEQKLERWEYLEELAAKIRQQS